MEHARLETSTQVVRVTRERTREALTRAWIRLWRVSTGGGIRQATTTRPTASGPENIDRETTKVTRDSALEYTAQRQRNDNEIGRQEQGMKIVRLSRVQGCLVDMCAKECIQVCRNQHPKFESCGRCLCCTAEWYTQVPRESCGYWTSRGTNSVSGPCSSPLTFCLFHVAN